jgi:hypothetical protein
MYNIYFAHSYVDYDTDYEQFCIDKIKKWCDNNHIYPYHIFNPKDVYISEVIHKKSFKRYGEFKHYEYKILKKYFYPLIDESDIVIVAKKNGKNDYSSGVKKEIEYAESINKQVICIEELKE